MNLTGIHHGTTIEFFARNGQQNLAQGFNPGLAIRSAGALKVAPEQGASTQACGFNIYPSLPILCPFRAQRAKTLNPALKPWAKFSHPFRVKLPPVFKADPAANLRSLPALH